MSATSPVAVGSFTAASSVSFKIAKWRFLSPCRQSMKALV
ncbi:hypothetical protein GGD54_005890 [Rhizobium tropici]|uniref:Uncharacterized protein n=1 Tax=Rhizobium tropici TaxID=398 RepID=A0ABR6R8E5_RHITR|nr:hypothetical protein [Rhizobium tropici]MBB5596465.1 hypothetical protein [Rhizobium tropici]MBB6495444.1 hypothetical protein [Rhizobium tropici]